MLNSFLITFIVSFINKDNGLLVKVNDIDELGKAMYYMTQNISFYDSEKIRSQCIEKYSKKKIISEILKLYRNVMEER